MAGEENRTPMLSIVIVAYNTRDFVLQCLSGLCDPSRERGWQIIVVDNGSGDGTWHAVSERFPEVERIRSERNLGFAGGANLGLRRARGRVIVLMNGDVHASASALEGAARVLLSRPEVGALSPLLRTPDGRPQPFAFGDDQSPGYLLRRGLRALLGRGSMHRWEVEEPIEVAWVSGACMLVRREVIEQVGLLDEGFFLYFEDNDWCLRMRKAGWRIVYDPRFAVVHVGGASASDRRQAREAYDRSLVRFMFKHYGPIAACGVWILRKAYRLLMGVREKLGRALAKKRIRGP